MIEVRPEQPQKAPPPILVTELGRVIEVRPEQPQKAELPILVTDSGIVIEVRPEQPQKAEPPILVTELGIIVFLHPAIKVFDAFSMMALQLFLLSYLGVPSSTFIEVRPEQPRTAPPPILVTLSNLGKLHLQYSSQSLG